MKKDDLRKAYEDFSGKASDIVRQLDFAGIALIWIFKVGTTPSPVLETQLLLAALLIFLSLFFDLLQYLLGTGIWFVYFRMKEKAGVPQNTEFAVSPFATWPTWTCFWIKSSSALIAYLCCILPFLAKKFIG
jgi:hypothetical protein